MDSRPLGRAARGLLIVFGLASLPVMAGCNLLAGIGYITHNDNTSARCNDLVGKRVAIVCRPVEQLQYSDSSAAPDLASAVGERLTKNVKGCKVISSSDVAEWADGHNWDEYVQVGKALKADMVVGIDLEQFSLNEGATLYKGRSKVHIWVYDVKNGSKRVFERNMPPTIYPPNAAVANTERPESEFRRQYIAVLAERIARHFYSYDARDDFALEDADGGDGG
jgi:hypothetical protein